MNYSMRNSNCLNQTEAGVSLAKTDVADNVDLLSIIQEFEEYYELKFGRKPKLVHKSTAEEGQALKPGLIQPKAAASSNGSATTTRSVAVDGVAIRGGVAGTAVRPKEHSQPQRSAVDGEDDYFQHRLLKPLPDFGGSELRDLAATITSAERMYNLTNRDIYMESPDVRWDSVKGLDEAKRLIHEAVVMPHKYPQFFTGLLAPWKGVLLYGPPGTGKTMLAKAVATECRTTFFNISASTIISKWRGDSEKLVRVLFELARYHAPSTIFLDEIDALMSKRGEGTGEHEASRRMKTELLIQMDGLAKSTELVFLLAATNLPWELDSAMLRRLEKRIYVPLPNAEARHAMLVHLLAESRMEEGDSGSKEALYEDVASVTEGYSGSDVYLVCKEAAMRPLRRLMARLEVVDSGGDSHSHKTAAVLGPITREDLLEALRCTKPSGSAGTERYQAFRDQLGSQL
eukprot:jgi/Chlat1/5156/Chrsp33S05036